MERTIAEGCIMMGAETVAGLSRANAGPPTPLPTIFYVEDAYCRDCDGDKITIDGKEEPTVYKTGEMYGGCDCDYDVLGRISWSAVDQTNEVWEQTEAAVQDYLE